MLNKIIRKARRFIKRNGGTILAVVGCGGVIVTAVVAAADSKKANEHIAQAMEEKGGELTLAEKADVSVMDYVPTAGSAVLTMACIMASDRLHRKHQAAMISAYAMLNNVHSTYRNRVRELDEEIDKQATSEVVKVRKHYEYDACSEHELFYESHFGDYFDATLANIRHAEYLVNRTLMSTGVATLGDFFRAVRGEDSDFSMSYSDLDRFEWSVDRGVEWIDFQHVTVTIDDPMNCCCIYSYPEPILV